MLNRVHGIWLYVALGCVAAAYCVQNGFADESEDGSEMLGNSYLEEPLQLEMASDGERIGFRLRGEHTWKIKPMFAEANDFSEGLAAVSFDDVKWGFIDEQAKFVIEPRYMFVDNFHEGLAAVVNPDGKCGFIDRTGRTRVAFDFEEAYGFRGGYAPVCSAGRWGYINDLGEPITKLEYEAARPASEGMAAAVRDDKWVFIDLVSGSELGPFEQVGDFGCGIAPVKIGQRWGYVGRDGKLRGEAKWEMAKSLEHGRGAVKQNGKWGFVNASAKVVVVPHFRHEATYDEYGRAVVVDEDGAHAIDHFGTRIVGPIETNVTD